MTDDNIAITANIHPIPTTREGSVQRVLDDELVNACATIRNTALAFKEDVEKIRENVFAKFLHEQELSDLVDFAREADKVQKVVDNLETIDKKIQQLSRDLAKKLQAHMSQLAICPKTGEYIVNCYTKNDCRYCVAVYPENYNHYRNPQVMPAMVYDVRAQMEDDEQ
jgi:hypothetical protein